MVTRASWNMSMLSVDMILVFFMLSSSPILRLSSLTFLNRRPISFSQRYCVVGLFTSLPPTRIPMTFSSRIAYRNMASAYRMNKSQPYRTSFWTENQFVFPYSIRTVASWLSKRFFISWATELSGAGMMSKPRRIIRLWFPWDSPMGFYNEVFNLWVK